MQLGIILRLLTVLAAFVLGRIAFDNPVFDEMLITLPAELVSYLFLFYWLHCYIREQIPKAGRYQLVKSACGSLLLLLLNLSGDVASALLSRVPRYFADIASLGYSLLLLAFVSSYVFYWTLKPAEEQGLRYPEFIRALFSFAKKKPRSAAGSSGGVCSALAPDDCHPVFPAVYRRRYLELDPDAADCSGCCTGAFSF